MSIFEIDSNIREAKTLSAEFYVDERHFEDSKRKVFEKTWQVVGIAAGVENLRPFKLLEDFLDEPLLLSRDSGRDFHCLSNVCTHRGNILVGESCKKKGIKCGYHGRCFDLNGKFESMPEFEGVEDFPSKQDHLTKVTSEVWRDFIFVSLSGAMPLYDFTGEMDKVTNGFDFANLRLVSEKNYDVKAHWALYCENYLEGFHIPFVHKSLNREIDYGSYTTEIFRYSSLQTGFDETGELAARYFFVFPNMMFNFYPWGISVNVVEPKKPDQTVVKYFTLVNDESAVGKGAGADLDTVELEDQAVVESVQKGIKSRFYDRGRYSPTREQGTHHFHRLIAEFMNK